MTAFLYTEDFETAAYRLYRWDGNSLHRLGDEENDKYLRVASKCECRGPSDESGVCVTGACGLQFYLAFNILINEVSPSGRRRLVFGFTESTSTPHMDGQGIKDAVNAFCAVNHISVPAERLDVLIKKLEDKSKMIQQRAHKRDGRIALAILTLGVSVILARKYRRDNRGDTTNVRKDK